MLQERSLHAQLQVPPAANPTATSTTTPATPVPPAAVKLLRPANTRQIGGPCIDLTSDDLQDSNNKSIDALNGECKKLPLDNNHVITNLYGTKVIAKVDTGADLNCISDRVFNNLPSKIKQKLKTSDLNVICANQTSVKAIGIITLAVYIQRQRYKVEFYVLPEIGTDMFLGVPFFKKFNACIDFESNMIELAVGIPVYCDSYIEIEPYTEIVCKGSLRNTLVNGTQGLCQQFSPACNTGILIANSIVTSHDSTVPVRLYNASDLTVVIKRGQRIATFDVDFESDDDEHVFDYECDELRNDNVNVRVPSDTRPTLDELNFDWSKSAVTDDELIKLKSVVSDYTDCFVDPKTKQLGLTDVVECKIETKPDAVPVHKYPYRMPPTHREELGKIINEQLSQGLIEEEFDGPWASPALLVKKASGAFRLVIDYRALNAATIPQVLRVPRLDDVLDSVGCNSPRFYSKLDACSGFHQIKLHPDSRHKTAFITPQGKYRYKVMAQGLTNAPFCFQSLMDILLKGIQYKYVMAYIDDIIIFSPDFDTHLMHIVTD